MESGHLTVFETGLFIIFAYFCDVRRPIFDGWFDHFPPGVERRNGAGGAGVGLGRPWGPPVETMWNFLELTLI